MRPLLTSLVLLSALALAGCSSSPASTATTPSTATTQQVASVLAAHQTDLHSLADDGNNCAVAMAGLTGNMALANECLQKASEAATSATAITAKWKGMRVPGELTDLVASTSTQLDALAAADITGPCGSDLSNQRDSACVDALSSWNSTLKSLSTQLDAWSPYL